MTPYHDGYHLADSVCAMLTKHDDGVMVASILKNHRPSADAASEVHQGYNQHCAEIIAALGYDVPSEFHTPLPPMLDEIDQAFLAVRVERTVPTIADGDPASMLRAMQHIMRLFPGHEAEAAAALAEGYAAFTRDTIISPHRALAVFRGEPS